MARKSVNLSVSKEFEKDEGLMFRDEDLMLLNDTGGRLAYRARKTLPRMFAQIWSYGIIIEY